MPQTAAGQAQISATKSHSASAAHKVPFAADEIRETTQTLADGTQITHKTVTKLYRDSEGRMHDENYVIEGGSSQPPSDSPKYIFIFDRVADVQCDLNPRDHTARRTSLTPSLAPSSPDKPIASTAASAPRPKATEEHLGQQEIEGVTAQGVRITRTIPVGAEGNDRPIVVTEELWLSPELNRPVLEDVHNPLGGNDHPPY